ncbi:MAG: NAD(P)-binding domain-containing protein, partial [Planctomycetota bacterium]|nr:NAD(P)-binding domain-containing protein [Planctomycetota bacterium]
RGGSLFEAARDSDLLVIAVPFGVAEETVRSLADVLADKIVVDITNPFGAITPGRISAVEVHANAVPSARWVAAYKTTFWKTLDQPTNSADVTRDVLVCSDDRQAGKAVMDLIASTGFRPVDCGSLENARAVDLMVPLMLELDERYQCECASGWNFLTAH